MSPLDFLIPAAHAQAAGAPAANSALGFLPILVVVAVMYFLMIRPQMKRAKEHRGMLEKLGRGDEVLAAGGLAGTVTDIGENFVTIEIADGVRVRVQKSAIGNVLPKGTLKAA
ncbi:preprotein translocase subunit YajC [Cognatilysobacter lacus]|uniref:Sec translocon accessory complex subunit YajC n=1 Tax=Cognatilysobacter lacus TaxID=1643323 RepID=A0A5D8Z563_9GAMM|nr:preprotein translocase subunit YajC [Lysobacter lacus]TZF90135.1 preprotein translocase subunit YajC [Lysobacter lacus]